MTKYVALATLTLLTACGGSEEEARRTTDNGLFGYTENSPQSGSILQTANLSTLWDLEVDVGVAIPIAVLMDERRNGPDERQATADDQPFVSLADLATISGMNAATFGLLDAFSARAVPLDLGSCDMGTTVHGIAESSDVAPMILAAALGASRETMETSIGLEELVARSIITWRDGIDNQDGSTDDRTLACLSQLAAIPNVDAVPFGAMATWAAAHGLGDTCAAPIPLTITPQTVAADSSQAGEDFSFGCVSNTGADVVFQFTLANPLRVHFESTGYDTVMSIRSGCPGTELVCDDDGAGGGGSLIEQDLAAGSYYLVVAGYGDNKGPFNLLVDIACPAGTIANPTTGECLDNPCAPNPCTEPFMGRCVLDDAMPPSHSCECNPGYLPDGSGGCMADPDGNDWSIIVFLNADNNLEDYGYSDVAEMGVAGSTPNVHIVALFDTLSQDGGDARKIYVTQGDYQVIDNLGEVDMGDWTTLRDFGVWAVQNYPARHYALILWDHGAGWKSNQLPAPVLKEFSNDDNGSGAGISISNGDYAAALAGISAAAGKKIDVVGFDACLMGMWEVADATAPYADYLVASEQTEPGDGWPYDDFLVPLINDPDMSPAAVATQIVEAYWAEDSGNSTLSVVDLATMDSLATAMDAFADAMIANPSNMNDYILARDHADRYDTADHRDLYTFAANVASSGVPSAVTTSAQAVVSQLDVSIEHNRSQGDLADSMGMAVYLPSTCSVDAAYTDSGATWNDKTSWYTFIDSMSASNNCGCDNDNDCPGSQVCISGWDSPEPFCENP